MSVGVFAAILFLSLFYGGRSLCDGLLLRDATCSGKCGQRHTPGLPCQCNSACPNYGDCCSDYETVCMDTKCSGKCGQRHTPGLPCQCNSACPNYGDCCSDYETVCVDHNEADSCPNFTDVTETLWRNDVNRLDASMYTLNFQAHINDSIKSDHAPAPFFTRVDSVALSSRPTFQKFLVLQNNYIPTKGHKDTPSINETAEVDDFLDSVLQTSVMKTLLGYLQCLNKVSDEADLRAELKTLWFTPYSRRPGGVSDSSGFEHVMVGEYKNSAKVNGLHSWLAYYSKEKAHEINYYGYVDKKSPDMVAVNYSWNGRHKALGSFFVGTSPEFDLALFTLCALTRNGDVRLSGNNLHIQIYDIGHISGLQIGTAYPSY